jgi:hypothetical protein
VICFAGVLYVQRSQPGFERADYDLRFLPKVTAAANLAEAIISSKLNPILVRQFQGVSEQELRDSVIAEKEIVQALEQAIAIARQAPAYKDARVENERQREIQSLERRIGEVERKTWQGLLGPAMRDELRLSGRLARQKVQPMLTLPAEARDQDSLKETESSVQEQMGKVAGLRELLQMMGPMKSEPGLEETRQEEIANLSLYFDLFKSAAIGLKDGAAWPEEQRKEYESLQAKVKERGS